MKNNGISNFIQIKGARVHNLKNLSVNIPRNKFVVVTGLSGSGKSSLVFDTLYAEGQRRYVESLSSYARQFLGIMDKPNVEKIEGISPAISIDQRKSSHNPRSTVGTITEIYDYLRLLFASAGKPHCPNCKKPVARQTIDQIIEQVLKLPKNSEITILGSVIRGKKGAHQGVLEEIKNAGFVRARIDKIIYKIERFTILLDKKKEHSIDVVVDRLILDKNLDRARLADSIETAFKLGKGALIINQKFSRNMRGKNQKDGESDLLFSEHFACEDCGISLPELEPRLFSFNSPFGACPGCMGLGEKLEVAPGLVMPNKNLTIAEGAIIPWMRASHKVGRQGYYYYQLSNLAEKYNFSLDEEIKNLPPKIIDIILYGDIKEQDKFSAEQGGFEGVIPNLERRYHETDSDWTRQEIEQYMFVKKCEKCLGKRLKPEILAVLVGGLSIVEISDLSIKEAKDFFTGLASGKNKLSESDLKVSSLIIKEIINRLEFLIDVGLHYLTISRKASTLSGGESQRIRLATQIGSKLTGVLYILDEPSVGLHPRDQGKLINTLKKLRDLGNTVIVVEHDSQTIKAADWVIDIGPGAGKHGGKLVFEGTARQLLKANTLTGEYLSGRKRVEVVEKNPKSQIPNPKKIPNPKSQTSTFVPFENGTTTDKQNLLTIKGARENNLKDIDVKIPLGKFVCVTGVSGSGKSSLVIDILAKELLRKFYRAKDEPGKFEEILGAEKLNKVVVVDQSPIGRTPRSNPATYISVFSYIRYIFSKTKEAKIKGYGPGRFSFNVKGGRCEACEGQGQNKVEMYFLPDIYVECQECHGKRYNKEALEIKYSGKNIAEVLEMTIEKALDFFRNIPVITQKLKTLNEVGLSYVELGQPAPSLSGGEAQRVKLAAELSKKATGRTLYILDEPTTGLHFDDVKKLVLVLRKLVEKGNTVLVIEHNLDLIRCSDYLIDLGPEGGDKGGYIIAEGAPEQVAKNKNSWTGKYLGQFEYRI